jgi:hypothetical protein
MIRRAAVASLLEGLLARGHEPYAVESQGFACYLCDDEMSVMNRVERSTEDATQAPVRCAGQTSLAPGALGWKRLM